MGSNQASAKTAYDFRCLCSLDSASGSWKAWTAYELAGVRPIVTPGAQLPGRFADADQARSAAISFVMQRIRCTSSSAQR